MIVYHMTSKIGSSYANNNIMYSKRDITK